jgi:hypothetical protein
VGISSLNGMEELFIQQKIFQVQQRKNIKNISEPVPKTEVLEQLQVIKI